MTVAEQRAFLDEAHFLKCNNVEYIAAQRNERERTTAVDIINEGRSVRFKDL